jgi:hypothetical protein
MPLPWYGVPLRHINEKVPPLRGLLLFKTNYILSMNTSHSYQCTICKETKDLSAFYLYGGKVCKKCCSKRSSDYLDQKEALCSCCGGILPLRSFPADQRKKTKRVRECRECRASRVKETGRRKMRSLSVGGGEAVRHWRKKEERYILRYPEREKAHLQATKRRKLDYVITYLDSHPCVDCGESDPIVLDFDHMDRKRKSFGVSEGIHFRSLPNLVKEIDKCVVRCANCHRRKTASEEGWMRFQKMEALKASSQPEEGQA